MLQQRIFTGLGLFILALGILLCTHGIVFNLACGILCLLANYELAKMYRFSPLQLGFNLSLNAGLMILIPQLHYDISQIIRIISVIMWCFVVPLVLIFIPKNFSKFSIMLFSSALFIPAYYVLIMLHAMFDSGQLISLMAIAWIADTGAYFTGCKFGKHKLAPKISPGKTIEGAIGGLILVILYLLILKYFDLTFYLLSYAMVFKFATIITIVSIAGDLFESWLKRVAKVKDSGSFLPGHGGIFDRIDSLIAVLAIAFAIIRGIL
jgi:phosphatidate cytidylyltransferase